MLLRVHPNCHIHMCANALPLLGGIQLRYQALQVPQSLGAPSVLERLVLGQRVDETFADVVTMFAQQIAAALPSEDKHLPDLAVGTEPVRHSAVRPAEG